MKFIDEVKISLVAGKGGSGCVSFRREKYVPKGGPDGGDGGKGGSIYLLPTERKHSLLDFRFKSIYKAKSGRHGEGSNRSGRGGEDLVLEIPVGTMVKDPETGDVLADLTEAGKPWLAAQGGMGGKGNAHFTSSTRQAPMFSQEGQPGQECLLALELKLLADVGLVGLPNAGKSTLISAVSAARPKIADYPFTTLVPNLGVVQVAEEVTFVMADIPGLIEGAHEGAGLGIRFLKHIERTTLLLHVIDVSAVSPESALDPYLQIEKELESYSAALGEKPRAIALNKIDLVQEKGRLKEIEAAYRQLGLPVFMISALARQGLRELVNFLAEKVNPPQEEKD